MKTKNIIASIAVILMMLCPGLTVLASTAPMPDLSGITYQEVFKGAEITVTDKTAQAVRIGAYEWPITEKTKMYFISADNRNLGYMSGKTYMSIYKNYEAKYLKTFYNMPGGTEGWYAQMFNDYRGVKRLTADEYLGINRIKHSALSGEEWEILEQVYGKPTDDSHAGYGPSASGGFQGNSVISASGSSQTAADYEWYRKEVFRLVNIERANAGLTEVVWDDDFAACAQIRAEEMTRKASHERPKPPEDTGKKWPANANGVGIYNAPSVADEQDVPHNWIMENAGYGYKTAEAVVKGWMNSPGHRANILRESHVRCGVGVYYAKDYPVGGCQIGWALWFDDYGGSSSSKSSSAYGTASNGTAYSLNKIELNLTAGEGYQLSVEVSGSAKDIDVEWVGSKIGKDILAVDGSGYVTTFYRDGLASATATLNVSAKIYASGKLVKTLNCKVVVTQ